MTPVLYLAIACACAAICCHLMIYAWKHRHRDSWWRALNLERATSDDNRCDVMAPDASFARGQRCIFTRGHRPDVHGFGPPAKPLWDYATSPADQCPHIAPEGSLAWGNRCTLKSHSDRVHVYGSPAYARAATVEPMTDGHLCWGPTVRAIGDKWQCPTCSRAWVCVNHQDGGTIWAPAVTTCTTCTEGVEELSRTTITGSWTCPKCGTPHAFVDGQPGIIDP